MRDLSGENEKEEFGTWDLEYLGWSGGEFERWILGVGKGIWREK